MTPTEPKPVDEVQRIQEDQPDPVEHAGGEPDGNKEG